MSQSLGHLKAYVNAIGVGSNSMSSFGQSLWCEMVLVAVRVVQTIPLVIAKSCN